MRCASYGLLFVLFSGCSGADFSVPGGPTDSSTSGGDTSVADSTADTTVEDTSVGDGSLDDTGAADAHKKDASADAPDATSVDGGSDTADASMLDTGTLDTGTLDTGKLDTGALDAGALDAGAPDTGTPDSGAPDTGAPDTAKLDTGTAEIGPACPMPKNTAVATEPTGSCLELTSALQAAFDGARACGCDADCSQTGAPNGCACTSYINPGSASYPSYVAAANAYEKGSCKPICPLLPCGIASPTCVAGKCAAPGAIVTSPDAGP
jgi:hypothetical protein